MPVVKLCAKCSKRRVPGSAHCVDHYLPRNTALRDKMRSVVLSEESSCWICGGYPRLDDPLVIDHLTPHAHAGTLTRENLRAAHRSCNERRGTTAPHLIPRLLSPDT